MPDRAALTELLETLVPRIEGIIARAAARAKKEIPVYEPVPELEIRDGIARDLGLSMLMLVEGRDATEEERRSLGMIGDARARQGLPLESMLHVYRITVDEIFQALWEAGEEGALDRLAVLGLTREVWRRADAAMGVAVAAYRHRETELLVADSERRSALVHALLFTAAGAPVAMAADAGIDPEAHYVALRARSAATDTRALLLDLQAPGVLDGGVVTTHGDDVVGFALDRPRLVPPAGVVIALGPAGPLSSMPRSFAVATRVVDTALASGRDGVLRIGDVALAAIARAEESLGDALVERYVAALDPGTPAGAEILETVRAYLACDLSAERAAIALSVHPNTVRNRLHRFEALTGASLQSVDELVRVRLALLRAEVASGEPR